MSKYIKAPNTVRKKVAVQSFMQGMNAGIDESILSAAVAKRIYNFDFSTGALREGYGLKEFPFINRAVNNIWTYRRHDFELGTDEDLLMYAGLDGAVYYIRNGTECVLEGVSFSSVPYAVNYRLYGDDVILLCSESDSMIVWDGKSDAYTVADSPFITSMTMHCERMFCTVSGERNAVWFSDDLDPTNWDLELGKGGFIQMIDERGKLNKTVSFLNYIYILRDYGISRLTAFADQSEFSVSNLFVSSGKIYAKSSALCGDTVLFLAAEGVYCFDGLATRKILPFLSPLILPSKNACGAFHDGKYYLAFRADFQAEDNSGTENNAVLIYDLKNGTSSILYGANITAFAPCSEYLLAVTDTGRAAELARCGHLFGQPTEKRWESGSIDFNTEKIKTVREVYVESDDAFTMTVYSEKASKDFFIVPDVGLTRIRVNLSGRKIGINMVANTEKARITRPTIVFTA